MPTQEAAANVIMQQCDNVIMGLELSKVWEFTSSSVHGFWVLRHADVGGSS